MGDLEIIAILCDVNARLSDLVERMAMELEQANIADKVQESIHKEMTECKELTDRAGSRLMRFRKGRKQ